MFSEPDTAASLPLGEFVDSLRQASSSPSKKSKEELVKKFAELSLKRKKDVDERRKIQEKIRKLMDDLREKEVVITDKDKQLNTIHQQLKTYKP